MSFIPHEGSWCRFRDRFLCEYDGRTCRRTGYIVAPRKKKVGTTGICCPQFTGLLRASLNACLCVNLCCGHRFQFTRFPEGGNNGDRRGRYFRAEGSGALSKPLYAGGIGTGIRSLVVRHYSDHSHLEDYVGSTSSYNCYGVSDRLYRPDFPPTFLPALDLVHSPVRCSLRVWPLIEGPQDDFLFFNDWPRHWYHKYAGSFCESKRWKLLIHRTSIKVVPLINPSLSESHREGRFE